MKTFLQVTGGCLGVIVALACIVGLGWFVAGNDLVMKQFFAPKYEEGKRATFEISKEYQHSTIQELYKMQTEYLKSTDEDFKKAIAKRALYLSSEFNKDNLPDDLREWIFTIE